MTRLAVIFTLVTVVLLCSCTKNPFSTRDSEPPTERAGTFIQPTSPQIVLENLRFAYAELVIGNFVQCLDSHFVFAFDLIPAFPGDTTWDFREEVRLTEKLFTDFSVNKAVRTITVRLASVQDQPDVILDTTATLVRSYVVQVTDPSDTLLQSYEGIALLSWSRVRSTSGR